MLWRVNPDEEILDWKAVCGRTARTVWREGRLVAFPTPIAMLKQSMSGISRQERGGDFPCSIDTPHKASHKGRFG